MHAFCDCTLSPSLKSSKKYKTRAIKNYALFVKICYGPFTYPDGPNFLKMTHNVSMPQAIGSFACFAFPIPDGLYMYEIIFLEKNEIFQQGKNKKKCCCRKPCDDAFE